jgi:cytochrome P450
MSDPLPPGPRLPAAVQTFEWVARPARFLERAAARHGEPFTLRTYWAGEPLVLVWSPEEVRRLFTAGPDDLRASGAPLLEPFAGPTSILVLEGEAHLRQRRLMLPPFHGERMRALQPMVAELAAAEVASWRPGEMRAIGRMQSLTLDIIMRAVFGTGQEALREDIRNALDVVGSVPRLTAMSVLRRKRVWAPFRQAVERVDERLFALVGAGTGGPILDLLLEARHEDGSPPAPREIRDQLVTLLAAGHETTATALAWAIELLARRPEVLARIRHGDDAYLDAVVKEVLRTRPVLAIASRTTARPYRAGAYELPKGTLIAACLHLALHRRESWGDPEAFRPERWLEGEPAEPYAFIPFGGGVRRCLGAAFATMEMREVLEAVAVGARLAPHGAAEAPRRRSVAIAPAGGARVRVLAPGRVE